MKNKITIYRCDLCGKNISAGKWLIRARMPLFHGFSEKKPFKKYDICESCWDNLRKKLQEVAEKKNETM